jgi:hypothetical protein
MRRRSSIDLAKQRERIERARLMTIEERLRACVRLSEFGAELQRVQRYLREIVPAKSRQ